MNTRTDASDLPPAHLSRLSAFAPQPYPYEHDYLARRHSGISYLPNGVLSIITLAPLHILDVL